MDAFDKYNKVIDQHMPRTGEGDTKASQVCTAVNKLIYKWFNDGDVYDNNYYLQGWANDISSYANWLAKYVTGAKDILEKIYDARNDDAYEAILLALAEHCLSEGYLDEVKQEKTIGTIYDCDGPFSFSNLEEEEEEEWVDDEDEEGWY